MSDTGGVTPEEFMAQNPISTGAGAVSSGYTGVSEGYVPPPRLRQPATGAEAVRFEREGRVRTTTRSVSGVVSPDNQVLPFYDLRTKPGELLGGMAPDPVSLRKFINGLYSRGWYGDKEPEGGLGDNDIEAVRNLLYYSNLQGVTWDTTFNTLMQAPLVRAGEGRKVQVTSTADLTEVANRAALQTIGRKLSDEEARRFAESYQAAQRSSAGSSMAAPSADTFFSQRIEQKYGAESEATKYLSAISNVAQILGGL
jgi:hypothetical protein